MSQQFRIQELDLSLIVFDEELQVRLETDQETVQDYYEAMATEEEMKKFPPPTVYFDGCRYWLADGHHRYWAAFRRHYKKMIVKVIDGSHDDALLAAVKLNAQNGLRFHDGDWEKIIPLISSKDQWKDWTNRRLAEELGCGETTIRRYRYEDSVAPPDATEKRKGKDGKMYKAKKTGKPRSEKSRKKSDPPAPQEPEHSTTPPTSEEILQFSPPETIVENHENSPSREERLAEADALRTRIHATISLLVTQLEEWFAIAPDDQHKDFDADVGARLRSVYK